MRAIRVFLTVAALFSAMLCHAQSWSASYESGLRAARGGHWGEARQDFLQAAAIRAEDASKPTILPGPITEQRKWRNGAPYSPNFLAAYAAYRNALGVKDEQAQTAIYHTVAEEMQTLVDKGQISAATTYFLNAVYTRLGETEKAQALVAKVSKPGANMDWEVDTEVVDPQEMAQITQMADAMAEQQHAVAAASQPNPPAASAAGPVQTIKAEQLPEVAGSAAGVQSPSGLLGPVVQDPNKFALLIGNGEYRLKEDLLPFAADDAQRIRQSLTMDAGYLNSNVDLVINATSDQILASARALADRVTEGSVVTIFYTGIGVNIDGKDYLVGSDAESMEMSPALVAKSDLYRMFMSKGAIIFAFYQVDRPIRDGRYFGMEVPMVGRISQTQATMPGDNVNSFEKAGKQIGIYTDAFVGVLGDQRTNHVPIGDFGWQVFYRLRRGDTGTTGGGSHQTPTLPVLTNMASDARF